VSHLANGHRRQVDKQASHILFASPVGPLYRILKVDIGGVAGALGHVAQGGLHPTLSGNGVRASGRHQREDNDLKAMRSRLDGCALASQAGANH
jgi:hypothetical protein